MTVSDFISNMQAYMNVAPQNGAAQIILRSEDGETCWADFAVSNATGLPGQHFCIFSPNGSASFKARDALKLT